MKLNGIYNIAYTGPRTHVEALEVALYLCLTAPTKAKQIKTAKLASELSAHCTPRQIEACKRRASAKYQEKDNK